MHRIFILLCFLPFALVAQENNNDRETSPFVIKLGDYQKSARTLENKQPFSALVIRSKNDLGLSIPISINGDKLSIPIDPDAPKYTYFISHGNILTLTGLPEYSDDIEVYLINTGNAPETSTDQRKENYFGCIPQFNSIPQSNWREGLPPPNYNRVETNVQHVVIHHSAGSNTNTNFTQVVRDLYIYHTQVNGWSDIGYNYLVAQNGSIYDGRDPGTLDQDNVLGAHFCGANSTTMGVCLLGNYETAQLTEPGYASLLSILSWKLQKEDLDPYSKHQHALGYFDAIIGHRDGCSTLCPGENVYARMDQIRNDVLTKLNCDEPFPNALAFQVSGQLIDARSTITVKNLSAGYDSYEWIFEGGIPGQASWSGSGVVNYNYPGVFDITLIGIADGLMDTLTRRDHIEVRGEVTIFPNPITPEEELAIQHHLEIRDVKLQTMEGQEYTMIPGPGGKYELPLLKPGTYVLRIETPQGIIGRKVIVNY